MIDFELNNKDLVKSQKALFDLKLISGRVLSKQLVFLKLISIKQKGMLFQPVNTIDWIAFMENINNDKRFAPIIFNKMKMLVLETYYVKNVVLSSSEIIYRNNSIRIKGICIEYEDGVLETLSL